MSSGRLDGEVFEMPIGDVEGWGDWPTHEQLLALFAAIGSPEQWAQRWGRCTNFTPQESVRIARMVEMGTSERIYPEFAHGPFRALFPTATAATWWLFLNGDGVSDAELCERLGVLMRRYKFDPDAPDAIRRARACVFWVEEVLRREGLERLSEALRAEDDAKGKGPGKGEAPRRRQEADGKGRHKGKGTRGPHA